MRFPRPLVPVVAVLFPLLCVQAETAKVTSPGINAENYRVYSASLPFGYHTQGLAIAIRSRTVRVPDLRYAANSVQKEFASMQQDPALGPAIREMLAQPEAQELAPRFHINEAVEMLNSDELDGQLQAKGTPLARKSGWRAFNEAHHDVDGLTEVSAIGFNPTHTLAVFYAIHRSGTGCADEGFEVLKKTRGQWRRSPDQGFSFAACN